MPFGIEGKEASGLIQMRVMPQTREYIGYLPARRSGVQNTVGGQQWQPMRSRRTD